MILVLGILSVCPDRAMADSATSIPAIFTARESHGFGLLPGHGGRIHLPRPVPPNAFAAGARRLPLAGRNSAERLKSLIASAEAGQSGYDAVHHKAARPPKPPTRMTVREIYRWIAATPGRPHAIGRYQFIPATLRRLMAKAALPEDSPFSPALQDRLADILLEEAGISDFLSGHMSGDAFMDNLALIWAGLPTSGGLSAYHGYAGNRATITRSEFEREFARIFP